MPPTRTSPPPAAFRSAPPEVKLVNAFARPFENAVATARTCYSSRIVSEADVSGDVESDPDKRADRARRRDALARSIYEAGHHTTLQHAHFQFSLANVSRQLLWSFLHAHPFYNSEQVSQRYVEVKAGAVAVPPLAGEALAIYEDQVQRQIAAYRRLIELLDAPAAREYYRLFPARQKPAAGDRGKKEVKKKAQEVARYVLPVATFAHLYHTVSGLTLLRYWRVCEQHDVPTETRIVVERMVEELLRHDPLFATVLEEPMPLAETPEERFLSSRAGMGIEGARAAGAFRREFDAELGGLTSKLVDWKARGEEAVAQAVREVLGVPRAALADEEAIRLALDPRENPYFGEAMTLTTLSKVSRALVHASYTFRKKLSHTADSQNQRHRMTPGSRPVLCAHLGDEPDVVVPELLRRSAAALDLYEETNARAWDAMRRLRALGVAPEYVAYLLPNGVAVRLTESADLLHLHHKLKSRLCYTAQEEIWRASLDEVRQIRDVHPRFARYLLPPCGLRAMTETRPLCPEGERYCGVPVWKLRIDDYARVI